MLNVYPRVGEVEVGPVSPLVRRGGFVFVVAFVLIRHAVEVKEVGNLAFFETLELLALQGPDPVVPEISPILSLSLEFELASVRSKMPCEPSEHDPGEPGIGDEVANDALQQVEQGLFIYRSLGHGRASAFHLADDRHAQAVECSNREFGAQLYAKAFPDPFLHFFLGIFGKCKQKQFRWAPVTLMNKPAGLGNDD